MEKNPAWLTPAVLGLAQELHKDFDRSLLPILADMLEEAGYQDPDILSHLRHPRFHINNSCWVVEAIVYPKIHSNDWERILRGGSHD